MEGDDQQRRRPQDVNYLYNYARSAQIAGRPVSSIRNSPARPSDGRVGHAQHLPPTASTTGPSISGSTIAEDVGNYGFAQSQQFQPQPASESAFTYPAGYQQGTQRAQQPSQHAQSTIYGISQQHQLQHQSPYDAPHPYQQRQMPAAEGATSQFGEQRYYNTGEAPNPPGPVSYRHPTFQQPAPYGPTGDLRRSTLASGYPVTDPNISPPSAPRPTGQQQMQPPPPPPPPQGQNPQASDAAYQQLLRQTNTLTLQSRLIEASQSLLQMSTWLLTNLELLGGLSGVAHLMDMADLPRSPPRYASRQTKVSGKAEFLA